MSKENKKIIIWCLIAVIIIIIIPFFLVRGADFGGSDDAGADAVSEVTGEEYEPWFTPIMEIFLQDEIPGEIESLLFCIQTGIGVGILAFLFGKWSERYQLFQTKKGREQFSKYITEHPETQK